MRLPVCRRDPTLAKLRTYRPSHATVVAYLALFVALGGGGAFAVTSIIGADGTINGCYAAKGRAKGTLRVVPEGARCRRGEKPISWNQRGEPGQRGAPGATNVRVRTSGEFTVIRPYGLATVNAYCQPGERVTGGGGTPTRESVYVIASGPRHDETDPGSAPVGWYTTFQNGTQFEHAVRASVVCASP